MDVGPRVSDEWLPEPRCARVSKDLVNTTAEHHIAAKEHRQEPIAHMPRLVSRKPRSRRGRGTRH